MPFNSKAVQELRRRKEISQYSLAVVLGVTPQTIYNYEHERSTPSIESLDKLYELALERGYKDIQFYIPPKEKIILESSETECSR